MANTEKKNMSDKVLKALRLMCRRKNGTTNGIPFYGKANWVSVGDFSKEEKEEFIKAITEDKFGFCDYCAGFNLHLEEEHVVPRAMGGSNKKSNLAYACRKCNELKSDKHPLGFFYGCYPALREEPHIDGVYRQTQRFISNRECRDKNGELVWKSQTYEGKHLLEEERESMTETLIPHFQAGKKEEDYISYSPSGSLNVKSFEKGSEVKMWVNIVTDGDVVDESTTDKIKGYRKNENTWSDEQRKKYGMEIVDALESA